MKDSTQNNICGDSDFDTRQSGKKICFTNGLEFEVINYETLRITANSLASQGTYELWIWSHHVDSTGTKLWSFRATPLTITISGPVIDCSPTPLSLPNKCSLEVEDP